MKTALTLTLAFIIISSGVQAQQVINTDLTVHNTGSFYTNLRVKGGTQPGSSANFATLHISQFYFKVANIPSPSAQGLTIGNSNLTQSSIFINNNGNVGIGTSNSATETSHRLSVNGSIRTKEIVCEANWADFVFAPNYKLMPLRDVETYINENKHLPEIPSAAEVEKDGVKIAEMESKLLQKVEELTLYLIQQNKDVELLKLEIEKLKLENAQLKETITLPTISE